MFVGTAEGTQQLCHWLFCSKYLFLRYKICAYILIYILKVKRKLNTFKQLCRKDNVSLIESKVLLTNL